MIHRMPRRYLQRTSRITASKELREISKNWPNSWALRELSLEAMTGEFCHCQSPTRRILILPRGGAIVYRVALWYPDFVTHLFSVCTPYSAPSQDFKPLEELVKTKLPNFTYQLQLGSGEIEMHISSKEQIKQFLNALYGGRGPNGEVGFIPAQGVLLENLPKLNPTPLLSEKVRRTRHTGRI